MTNSVGITMPWTALFLALSASLLLAPGAAHVEFEGLHVPVTSHTKHSIENTRRLTIGELQVVPHSFQKIARTGEDHNCRGECRLHLGALTNNSSRFLVDYDSETFKYFVNDTSPLLDKRRRSVSHSPSGSSMIQGRDGKKWYMIYHFSDPQPGVVYQVELRLESETKLASKEITVVPFEDYEGVWHPAGATIIPWDGAHLGVEGTPPDARAIQGAQCLFDPSRKCLAETHPVLYKDIIDFLRYWLVYPANLNHRGGLSRGYEAIKDYFDPYSYGYPFTIYVDSAGAPHAQKLYSLGRIGAESIYVMPDYRTVYMTGQSGGIFKFVAAEPSNLSKGTLFAAKITITEASVIRATALFSEGIADSSFQISWVELGELEDTEPSRILFDDIFETEEPEGGQCQNLTSSVVNGRLECLAVRTGLDDVAVKLETTRFAAMRGATMSIFQFSGLTYDGTKLFVGVPSISQGAVPIKVKGNREPTANEMLIEPNPCGCLMSITLDRALSGRVLKPIMCGIHEDDKRNSCNTERIANPHSLSYIETFKALLVGEKSDHHENNAVWIKNQDSGNFVRIFTAPVEGGITDLNWYQDVIGGNNYFTLNIARPYDTFGWMGYFGAFDISRFNSTFSTTPVPYAPGPKKIPRGFSRITTGNTAPIPKYQVVFRTGDVVNTVRKFQQLEDTFTIGEVVNVYQRPVDRYEEKRGDPEKYQRVEGQKDVSNTIGYTTTLNMCGFTAIVSNVGSLPASSFVLHVDKESKAKNGIPLNWEVYGGLWKPSGGIVSPWNSVFGGESHEPDAQHLVRPKCITGSINCLKARTPETYDDIFPFLRYYDIYIEDLQNNVDNLRKYFKPYRYGYVTEIKTDQRLCSSGKKWYTLGRFSHGSIQIMPDKKTIYMTDWTEGEKIGGGFFKFIAERDGDLSQGTLYAAKLTRESPDEPNYNIEWIELASARNEEILDASSRTSFSDLFEYTVFGGRSKCPDGRTPINVRSTPECLTLKPGKQKLAAFLETRRYAAYVGATTEWGNLRGLVYDSQSEQLFISVTRVDAEDTIMLQESKGSPNHLQLGLAPCGCMFKLPVEGKEYDTKRLIPHVCGRDDTGTSPENSCNKELISNPGELSLIPGQQKLIVAENSCKRNVDVTKASTCGHTNNNVWTLNPFDRSDLTRVVTTPYKSKPSSMTWAYNSELEGVVMQLVVNEPYDNGKDPKVDDKESTGPAASFGFVGPFTDEEFVRKHRETPCSGSFLNKGFHTCERSSYLPPVVPPPGPPPLLNTNLSPPRPPPGPPPPKTPPKPLPKQSPFPMGKILKLPETPPPPPPLPIFPPFIRPSPKDESPFIIKYIDLKDMSEEERKLYDVDTEIPKIGFYEEDSERELDNSQLKEAEGRGQSKKNEEPGEQKREEQREPAPEPSEKSKKGENAPTKSNTALFVEFGLTNVVLPLGLVAMFIFF